MVSASSRVVLRAWFRQHLRFENLAQVPMEGPLLVVCNHISNVDPFLFGGYMPGTMYCMAKRELFRIPPVAWVLGGCNCFPVDRGAPDRWALRTSLDVLRRGGRLLIFIEGTRSHRPGMQRAEPGVGFLARLSGAPVLPVAVHGTETALHHVGVGKASDVTVRFGETFSPQPSVRGKRDDRAVADAIAQRIAALLPAEYRGVYAEVVEAPVTSDGTA
jgi:1-acyl-sn-glycerol-3-phosphate acyltransferase